MSDLTPSTDDYPTQSQESTGRDAAERGAREVIDAPEHLMPYGAAAKAIFIKANGLKAYNTTMRYRRRTE
jgi:hypothetical protein